MTTSTRYLLSFAIFVGLLLAGIATLNISRDSSGLLAAVNLRPSKPTGGDDAWQASVGLFPVPSGTREAKVFNAIWYKPQVALLGSSTVWNVVNANRLPELQQPDGRYAYNFGIAGVSISEMELIFEHLLALGSLKKAILGLELFMFSASDLHINEVARLPLAHRPDYPRRLWTYLGPRVVALDVTARNLADLIKLLTRSLRAAAEALDKPENTIGAALATTENPPMTREVRDRLHANDRGQIQGLYIARAPFTFSNGGAAVFDPLQRIIAQARRYGIELEIYVSPHQARAYETMRALGLWSAYQTWLRRLASLVDEVNAGRPCGKRMAILNFGAYKPGNLDVRPSAGVADGAYADYWDSYHFKEKVASQVFKTVLAFDPCGALPEDSVATSLTGDTIEGHIAKIEIDREAFVQMHADEMADVATLVNSVPGREILLQRK